MSKKLFKYTEESMQSALRAIRDEGIPVATACKTYNVPRTSVRNRLSGKTNDDCRKVGPDCVLGEKIEKKLIDWLIDMASKGFPINREALAYSVKILVEEFDIKTCFINNTPGKKWFQSFLKRHPQISQKHAEFINKARAATSEEKIKYWFDSLEKQLGPHIEVLKDPERIFNMDETAIFLAPKGSLLLGEKGKRIYDVVQSSEKDNVTTLMTVNAKGLIAPPLTIYKFKRLPKIYPQSAPGYWGIGISESGWMQSKQFFEYFANIFNKFLNENNVIRPVIVFMDGHASHLSLNLSKFCKANDIILVCLPPNTTHILQPLDVSFFFPLKQAWKNIVRKWRFEHDGLTIQKKDIPAALHEIITGKDFSKTIVAGFRTCGLFPFDKNAPDYSKCIKTSSAKSNSDTKELPLKEVPIELNYIEKHISLETLNMFQITHDNATEWEGEERYVELFKLWKKLKQSNQTEAITDNVTNPEENFLVFDFPEFDSLLDVEGEENMSVLEEADESIIEDQNTNDDGNVNLQTNNPDEILWTPFNASQTNNPDGSLEASQTNNHDKSIDISNGPQTNNPDESLETLQTNNSDKSIHIFNGPQTNNTDESLGTFGAPQSNNPDESSEIFNAPQENNPDDNLENAPCTSSSTWSEVRKLKQKTVSEVLKEIIVGQENGNQSTPMRKKHKASVVSVVTSDAWIDLMEAKENEKNTKGTSKRCAKNKNNENEVPAKQTKTQHVDKVIQEKKDLVKGTFVIVKYDNEYYPAKIMNTRQNEYYCCAMTKSGKENWKWPDKNDLLWYQENEIICTISEPQQVNNRGVFSVPEMKNNK